MPRKPSSATPEVGGRFKKLRSSLGLSQTKFAEILNISQSALSLVERGEAPPPFECLQALACGHPEIDLRLLICGAASSLVVDASQAASLVHPVIRPLTDNLHDLPPEGVADDYVAVPLVEGRVAAGPGAVAWDKVRSLVWVYKPEIGRLKNLVAVQVVGDSMQPTIPDGAIIIIDRDARQPRGRRKAIWALRTEDGECQVKRLYFMRPRKGQKGQDTWLVFSDNPDFSPEPAWTREFKDLVIGKVVWMWRSLI
ncbi:MAG: helix-turn-helix transcriptional regulator [Desulfarculus sp.]|nr:helix-turn-helix transcriptional regulator [Desulfarculus sp.]